MTIMRIGLDLAKNVFDVHGVDEQEKPALRKTIKRCDLLPFFVHLPPCIVAMESCGSAHYWAREMAKLGHEVRLIAPQYVRPFVKRQKNDAADAEAIVIAAQRPEMRFITPKAEDQQARALLFRVRERLVRQRTELVNALRSVLYEFGHPTPPGIGHLKRIEAIIEADNSDLPELVCGECRDLLLQISEKTQRIETKTKQIGVLATQTDTARRLQTMPGIGPMSALAVEAFAPPMESFRRGRDFAAWLGLVPRQHSSGGKERLGRISKAGQTDIRRLLIVGAMSRLNWLGRKTISEKSWLSRMLARKPRMLVAIALANKMARTIWAMLTKGQDYQKPAEAAAA